MSPPLGSDSPAPLYASANVAVQTDQRRAAPASKTAVPRSAKRGEAGVDRAVVFVLDNCYFPLARQVHTASSVGTSAVVCAGRCRLGLTQAIEPTIAPRSFFRPNTSFCMDEARLIRIKALDI
ncbi:hypothetical protein EYF80_011201 [Liparis tanakae]|uniref:Uncharacterized protein n=1 Tax=Liparis tanakae TaxID=230148 RepID=A0A4Z2IL21_9TELE|nr:hypothetical protein EYF80_011201 [Liparis tanakae]